KNKDNILNSSIILMLLPFSIKLQSLTNASADIKHHLLKMITLDIMIELGGLYDSKNKYKKITTNHIKYALKKFYSLLNYYRNHNKPSHILEIINTINSTIQYTNSGYIVSNKLSREICSIVKSKLYSLNINPEVHTKTKTFDSFIQDF